MTDDIVREQAIEMLQRVQAMLEDDKIDPEKGKIFWPIKEGDCPDVNDAYATLYELSDVEFCLSFYDETGNEFTDTLHVVGLNMGSPAQGGPTYYWRKPLKEMLEEELQIYIDENTTHYAPARLLARLIKAFEEEQ